jgi:hypothetical protein
MLPDVIRYNYLLYHTQEKTKGMIRDVVRKLQKEIQLIRMSISIPNDSNSKESAVSRLMNWWILIPRIAPLGFYLNIYDLISSEFSCGKLSILF